jgi:hypothetical protein
MPFLRWKRVHIFCGLQRIDAINSAIRRSAEAARYPSIPKGNAGNNLSFRPACVIMQVERSGTFHFKTVAGS